MPRVIDYKLAAGQLTRAGFVCLYHNSGAFGFPAGKDVQTLGWIGSADDTTIRPEMLAHVHRVGEPAATELARLAQHAWTFHLNGECWLTPKSHWHYEMHYGNRALLEEVLPALGINSASLADRNDGSPIAFSTDEADAMFQALHQVLQGLRSSDFQLTFPTRATVCTIHHHQQLWWQTVDASIAEAVGRIAT